MCPGLLSPFCFLANHPTLGYLYIIYRQMCREGRQPWRTQTIFSVGINPFKFLQQTFTR